MKLAIEESVLRQALDKMNQVTTLEQEDEDTLFDAITALRTALDAAEKVEPVAWRIDNGNAIPLYAAPTPPTNTDVSHTDHPSRHWDRTCPACNPADSELREAARAVVEYFAYPPSGIIDRLRKAL